MKYITTAVSMMLLMLAVVAAVGQSSNPTPAPELKQWGVWVGDWALTGTAKDAAAGPEYKVDWHMHGHWILNGFFAEVDHIWKGNGDEQRWLEILSYDQIKKIHSCFGFGSDGTTWNLTATFDKEKSFENVTVTSPDGEVTTCHMTWVFSADRMTVSGTQECEAKGTRWTAFQVKGTKSKTTH